MFVPQNLYLNIYSRKTQFFPQTKIATSNYFHHIIAEALCPPADWRRPAGRLGTTWLRTVDETSSPRTLEFTLPGGRPRIGTSGAKSSVRQRSDRSRQEEEELVPCPSQDISGKMR